MPREGGPYTPDDASQPQPGALDQANQTVGVADPHATDPQWMTGVAESGVAESADLSGWLPLAKEQVTVPDDEGWYLTYPTAGEPRGSMSSSEAPMPGLDRALSVDPADGWMSVAEHDLELIAAGILAEPMRPVGDRETIIGDSAPNALASADDAPREPGYASVPGGDTVPGADFDTSFG